MTSFATFIYLLVLPGGLEPLILSGLKGQRSNHLNYGSILLLQSYQFKSNKRKGVYARLSRRRCSGFSLRNHIHKETSGCHSGARTQDIVINSHVLLPSELSGNIFNNLCSLRLGRYFFLQIFYKNYIYVLYDILHNHNTCTLDQLIFYNY